MDHAQATDDRAGGQDQQQVPITSVADHASASLDKDAHDEDDFHEQDFDADVEHETLTAEKQHKKAAAPHKQGFRKVWVDEFNGRADTHVNQRKWNTIEAFPVWPYNNEKQAYTRSTRNAFLSGDGELVIHPHRLPQPRNDAATWTSARLECKHAFKCNRGEKMFFQAEIKLGDNPQQLGIWPAFWALGERMRLPPPRYAEWPSCGEWDIMEVVNGSETNHGTIHFSYDANPGDGVPGPDAGADVAKFSRTTGFERGKYHTFSFRVNRTPSPWQNETLKWYVDGREFFRISGADVGTEAQWKQLAYSAYYPILNVAVGGTFPDGVAGQQTPNGSTEGGLGSGMRVRYVAVYKSADGPNH